VCFLDLPFADSGVAAAESSTTKPQNMHNLSNDMARRATSLRSNSTVLLQSDDIFPLYRSSKKITRMTKRAQTLQRRFRTIIFPQKRSGRV